MRKNQISGVIFVFLSAVIFGFTPVLAAISYQGGNNGINMAFLRAFLPIPVLLLLWFFTARKSIPSRRQVGTGVILGGLLFGCTLLLYSSYAYISPGIATTLHFMYPLYVVLFNAIFRRQKPGMIRITGMVLGLIGAALLVDLGGSTDPVGLLLAFLSGIFYAAYILVLQKESAAPMPLYQLMTIVSASGAVLCAVVGLAMGKLTVALTAPAWGYAVCVAMLTAIVGCVLFQAGVRRVGDANAAIFSLLEPLTSIVFGVLLLHDLFSLRKGLGCGLILLGLLCTSCADLVKKKEAVKKA